MPTVTVSNDDDYKKHLEICGINFEKNWNSKSKDSAKLDDFNRLGILGQGAFGIVFLVEYKATKSPYALKVLCKKEIVQAKNVRHAISEKKMLASIDSPFLIRLFYSFKDTTYLYMVLDLVVGGEMFDLLQNLRKFNEVMVKYYAAQVFLAFEYLHYMNIAYRDLKPENILICADGYIKVADLGFAKQIPKDKRTWTLCGTPDYLAPETILQKGYSVSVDWWAFGVLLYEMTAGFPPFAAEDTMKTFELIVHGKVKFTPSFNKPLKDLIKNLIQVDLSKRYGNLKNGSDDIKSHKFFSDTNFISIFNRKVEAPFVPTFVYETFKNSLKKWSPSDDPLKIDTNDKYAKDLEEF